MSDRVTIAIDEEGIADVRLNRPNKLNACDLEMIEALGAAGSELAKNRSLRAVVLSGEGKAFCAGLDVALFSGAEKSLDELLERDTESPANLVQRAAWVWTVLPVPVIAAIHGVAFGAGFQVALAADIRCVAPDAKLSAMEIKWGLIPDMSITQTLRDLLPLDVAKELTFSGRILSGEQAQALGLVTHVSEDPLASAMTLAEEIAGKSPDAIRAGKQLFEDSWHADERTGLEMESRLQVELIGSPNQVEAIKANFENRAPDFTD